MSNLNILCLAALLNWGCFALAQTGDPSLGRTGVPGGRQIDRHNPYSPRYIDMRPGSHVLRNTGYTHYHGRDRHYRRPYYGYRPFFGYRPYYGFGNYYGYTYQNLWAPSYGFGYSTYVPTPIVSYPYGFQGQWGPYSGYGPLVLPTGALYGVQHLNSIVPGAVPTVQTPAVEPQTVEPEEPAEVEPRVSNLEARGRAMRFIEFGDRHFAAERYFDAYQRYKSSSKAAPDVAAAYFRQGFALSALGRYERAFEAMRKGLVLDPEWSKSNFKLVDVFGDNDKARDAHFEQLAEFVDQHPQHGEATFLLGVSLYFDGQQERSGPFFRKARELLEFELAEEMIPARDAKEPAEQPAPAANDPLEI